MLPCWPVPCIKGKFSSSHTSTMNFHNFVTMPSQALNTKTSFIEINWYWSWNLTIGFLLTLVVTCTEHKSSNTLTFTEHKNLINFALNLEHCLHYKNNFQLSSTNCLLSFNFVEWFYANYKDLTNLWNDMTMEQS